MKKHIIEKKRRAETTDDTAIKYSRKTASEYQNQLDDFLVERQQEDFHNSAPTNKAVDTWHIEAMTEYYNLKYPERGKITPIFIEQYSCHDSVIEKIKNDFADNYPAKIVITTIFCGRPSHSHPFVITQDKLISMRNDPYLIEDGFYEDLAKALELRLITPQHNNQNFQTDNTSCHMIAMGILKDLTKQDVERISGFEDDYIPMPKSLKYCQSRQYLDSALTLENKDDPVKAGGTTAKEYLEKHRSQTFSHADVPETQTRISKKAARLIGEVFSIPSTTPILAAQQVLEKFRKEKIDRSQS